MLVSNGYRKNFPNYLTKLKILAILTTSYETYDQMAKDISRYKHLS